MERIEKLLDMLQKAANDSFLQHALALEYIKIGDDDSARKLFDNILVHEPTYVGSYYHLAKLLERLGEKNKAVEVYTRGIKEARNASDNHAYAELKAALDDLEDED